MRHVRTAILTHAELASFPKVKWNAWHPGRLRSAVFAVLNSQQCTAARVG